MKLEPTLVNSNACRPRWLASSLHARILRTLFPWASSFGEAALRRQANFVNDLHKGRDTGAVWSWAMLLKLVSLTGRVLKARMVCVLGLQAGSATHSRSRPSQARRHLHCKA
jgi:predicted deacylase